MNSKLLKQVLEALDKAGTSDGAKRGWETRRRGGQSQVKVSRGSFVPAHTQADEERVKADMKAFAEFKQKYPFMTKFGEAMGHKQDNPNSMGTLYPENSNDYIEKLSKLPTDKFKELVNLKEKFINDFTADSKKPYAERDKHFGLKSNNDWADRVFNSALALRGARDQWGKSAKISFVSSRNEDTGDDRPMTFVTLKVTDPKTNQSFNVEWDSVQQDFKS
jgi:hypothetical protein